MAEISPSLETPWKPCLVLCYGHHSWRLSLRPLLQTCGLTTIDLLTEDYWTDWNGAIMVPHAGSLVARIFANIFVWSILVYGLFFIAIYKVSLG